MNIRQFCLWVMIKESMTKYILFQTHVNPVSHLIFRS